LWAVNIYFRKYNTINTITQPPVDEAAAATERGSVGKAHLNLQTPPPQTVEAGEAVGGSIY
jgi:hypothetical protein